jgi:hypothetical protein
MSKPARKLPADVAGPQHAPDLLEFQRRMEEQGVQVKLPSLNPNWELPEPIDLGGASLSDMVIRLRRGELQDATI